MAFLSLHLLPQATLGNADLRKLPPLLTLLKDLRFLQNKAQISLPKILGLSSCPGHLFTICPLQPSTRALSLRHGFLLLFRLSWLYLLPFIVSSCSCFIHYSKSSLDSLSLIICLRLCYLPPASSIQLMTSEFPALVLASPTTCWDS